MKNHAKCMSIVKNTPKEGLTDTRKVKRGQYLSSCLGIRIYPLTINFKWNGDMTEGNTRQRWRERGIN